MICACIIMICDWSQNGWNRNLPIPTPIPFGLWEEKRILYKKSTKEVDDFANNKNSN